MQAGKSLLTESASQWEARPKAHEWRRRSGVVASSTPAEREGAEARRPRHSACSGAQLKGSNSSLGGVIDAIRQKHARYAF